MVILMIVPVMVIAAMHYGWVMAMLTVKIRHMAVISAVIVTVKAMLVKMMIVLMVVIVKEGTLTLNACQKMIVGIFMKM